MLSREDNELMCRVGPESANGRALRRYWTPALQSSDLPECGGDPRLVRLLGENFVAFRGSDGHVAFLADNCCHRGVSLSLGRVEGCTIRCIFHGWRYDAEGRLVEAPNVSEGRFRERVRQPAYPVREAGGLIWVYLGEPAKQPRFPHFPWFDVDEEHRINAYLVEDANFVQVQEALVDSSHLNILHTDGLNRGKSSDLTFAADTQTILLASDPLIEADETGFGFQYAALRPSDQGTEARITAFIAPYAVANPNGDLWMAVVPVDDTRSVYFHVWWDENDKIGQDPYRSEHLRFIGLDDETLRAFGTTYETIDDPSKPSLKNRFRQARDLIRAGRSFSGLGTFTQEDSAVIMSAGAIKDRTNENLCRADLAINRLYRVHLANARAAQAGEDPIGLDYDVGSVIGIQGVVPAGGWRALVADQCRRSSSAGRSEHSAERDEPLAQGGAVH